MFILASSSPTRAKILDDFGLKYVQKTSTFDESSVKSTNPIEFVYKIAKGKKSSFENGFADGMDFLVADTVVVANKTILQKAQNVDDARVMLNLQSGNSVEIITCMIYKSIAFEFVDISKTEYIFDKFLEDDLIRYLQSGEWKGKAGACMVEGFCKPYIKSVVGLQSTAMGLSIEKLVPFLDLKNVI